MTSAQCSECQSEKFNQAGARVEQGRAEPNVISASALDVKVMKFNQPSRAWPLRGQAEKLPELARANGAAAQAHAVLKLLAVSKKLGRHQTSCWASPR